MNDLDIFHQDGKKSGFNIIKGDATKGHGGFGAGLVNLDNLSPVIIDVEAGTAAVDIGALHARSDVERRIRFSKDKADLQGGGKKYWLVWVNTEITKEGPHYSGAGAAEMIINRQIRRGYKVLADHVNKMDKALKGKVAIDEMDAPSKRVLRDFLEKADPGQWQRANAELKEKLEKSDL
ncbi:YwhD family protein [Sporolactobacillus sp. CQH2019]|uniref:YwhD family protein n=1 Tax=Sporolactobacillus sp. CQH2019 TaxID=3023512 RepID=UPI00236772BB|nr:YwhD family protein [Sporolactobacillus sp. CQH2019]MDD9148283.1 YwhD family protein [Sporolactobacillus sp. CQH2019]